uniref:EGF-like domain-containing protein n=1 Tax=Ditylum brightwellii TaxID=49249 RepID=A0A7S1ZN06_9STRA|mmetsp:Transcript_34849/g.51993  ORF Transcript_34849/g.51993 Transcript_34849/m.51993 type:complete len:590 (+) Transcript_34849:91-1860(+)
MEKLRKAAAITLAISSAISLAGAAAAGEAVEKECTLHCHQHGICAFGQTLTQDTNTSVTFPWEQETDENGMYCICDEGYVGLKCHVIQEVCGEASGERERHVCHHGSSCVHKGGEDYSCDCTTANVNTAGTYCEYKETEKCDDAMFCVNDGACVKHDLHGDSSLAPFYTCRCPNGYEGPHCEYIKGENHNCNLDCKNGGMCVAETFITTPKLTAALNGLTPSTAMEHCSCPRGFIGNLCEMKVEECHTDQGNLCFNGGTCVSDENSGVNYCDCTTAVSGSGDSFMSYAGPLCRDEATTYCDAIDGRDETQEFCTHGGTCRDKTHEGCDCPDDREGLRCEYSKFSMPECDLDCKNDGKCRFGIKTEEWVDLMHLDGKEGKVHDNGMHCSCPSGFSGVRCDIEYDTCHTLNDKNPHICQHGGSCVLEGTDHLGNNVYGCDCSTSDISVAGMFCEHIAEEFCVKGQESGFSQSFCTNGGKCKSVVEGDETHPGCTCPANFDGDHCEIPVIEIFPTSQNIEKKAVTGNSTRKIVGLTLITLSAGIIISATVYKDLKGRLSHKPKEAPVAHETGMMTPSVEFTEDGEMVDVEII